MNSLVTLIISMIEANVVKFLLMVASMASSNAVRKTSAKKRIRACWRIIQITSWWKSLLNRLLAVTGSIMAKCSTLILEQELIWFQLFKEEFFFSSRGPVGLSNIHKKTADFGQTSFKVNKQTDFLFLNSQNQETFF